MNYDIKSVKGKGIHEATRKLTMGASNLGQAQFLSWLWIVLWKGSIKFKRRLYLDVKAEAERITKSPKVARRKRPKRGA